LYNQGHPLPSTENMRAGVPACKDQAFIFFPSFFVRCTSIIHWHWLNSYEFYNFVRILKVVKYYY